LSRAADAPRGVLAAVERLRSLSRLALAAIERDDLETLGACVAESDALVAALARAGACASEDTRGLLSDVRLMNGRLVARLEEERARVAEELVRVGFARARLKDAQVDEESEPVACDRSL
jgi:hypothetical protein